MTTKERDAAILRRIISMDKRIKELQKENERLRSTSDDVLTLEDRLEEAIRRISDLENMHVRSGDDNGDDYIYHRVI